VSGTFVAARSIDGKIGGAMLRLPLILRSLSAASSGDIPAIG